VNIDAETVRVIMKCRGRREGGSCLGFIGEGLEAFGDGVCDKKRVKWFCEVANAVVQARQLGQKLQIPDHHHRYRWQKRSPANPPCLA